MHWVTARRRLVSTSLYGTEYPARFVLHSGTGLGSGRSCHRYRISQGVSAILCYIYMMRRFDILKTTPAERKFDGALARIQMYIGVSMGLQFSITAIGSIMLQSANNALGTACVAAFTAAMRIKMFSCVLSRVWAWQWPPIAGKLRCGQAGTYLDGSQGKHPDDDCLLGVHFLCTDVRCQDFCPALCRCL